jgi:hypothetical protein
LTDLSGTLTFLLSSGVQLLRSSFLADITHVLFAINDPGKIDDRRPGMRSTEIELMPMLIFFG